MRFWHRKRDVLIQHTCLIDNFLFSSTENLILIKTRLMLLLFREGFSFDYIWLHFGSFLCNGDKRKNWNMDVFYWLKKSSPLTDTNLKIWSDTRSKSILPYLSCFADNTAGIETWLVDTGRSGQEPFPPCRLIEDSSYPVQSSTNTMTIRVCRCDSDVPFCLVTWKHTWVGLSTGALIAILCIVILSEFQY